ncbi:piggyBac transposable element-derived protein 4-like [Cheilinus undulatus]|uniref:piggyBac transposable element-derived protein 4-like n=1 Tax=Cheilinus undulatus TaxID=241271 RepID=UPI001BD5F6F1|nr:piggyBac transposable element-derived protein 4-like [Cheilinus undulatus]
MRRSLNFQQLFQLFYGEADADGEPLSSSSSEEESGAEDDEVTDPSFLTSDERYEENGPSPHRTTQRGRGRRSQTRSRSPQAQSHHCLEPWRTRNNSDTTPQISRFMPRRTPGAQVDTHAASSPLDLFQLYFSPTTVLTLCTNTNKYAAKNKERGKKYKWADVEVEELYKFLGLLTYTLLVSLPSITDYWKQNTITSVPFPATVMARDRFRALLWNIHPSDPEEAKKNDEKKGTQAYDQMFKIKPLINDILGACKAHNHPRKEMDVDDRMMSTKEKTGTTQFMKDKPSHPHNKKMGGVDVSYQLLQYYSTNRRTTRWYRTLFLHLVDIATTNAYILHCDISASNQVEPMSHKDFLIELVSQLCGLDSTGMPTRRSADHISVAIAMVTDASMKATQGRRICQHCHQVDKKRHLTPWKCQSCDVALCLIVDRNCFAEWHR